MKRHFTATGFVVHRGKTLLHWHRRLQQWMPPGGHLLPDEDPVAGVLREIHEETGVEAEVLSLRPAFPFSYPRQLPAPYTILVEDSADAGERHQHIDFIYFCRSPHGEARSASAEAATIWATEEQLQRKEALPLPGRAAGVPVADDVRLLALEAIRAEREADGS
jgi:8-oxo-dGTP diphosphatase